MDADIVQSCREVLKVLQRHLAHVLALMFQIVEQLAQVTLVGVERVARHVPLQLQVAYIAFRNVFFHILCKVTDFFLNIEKNP